MGKGNKRETNENTERTMKEQRNAKQPIQRCNDWRTGQKFNKDELIELSLRVIEQHDLVFISEIIAFLPCSQSTFYSYKLERTELLKEALHRNRISLKLQIRRKLLESDNPIALIASYKLFANQEELQRLSNNSKQTMEHTQSKPFSFTLNLNPDNRVRERLTSGETKQISGESDFIDAETEDG
jgi:hypothetical protein